MQDAVANPWAAKARALDRYRWLLLRERHGLLGSALRFAREALGDWWFGVRAKSRLAESVTAEPCDFLLLQSAPKVIAFQRKKLLIEGLRSRGDNLVETALQEPRPSCVSACSSVRPSQYRPATSALLPTPSGWSSSTSHASCSTTAMAACTRRSCAWRLMPAAAGWCTWLTPPLWKARAAWA